MVCMAYVDLNPIRVAMARAFGDDNGDMRYKQ
jgi:hypothetical protein